MNIICSHLVSPHQDSTFLHTDPLNIVGLWFALEDVTLENGCLWFIPGSHKQGISRRFIRNPDTSSPNLTIYTQPNPDYDETKFIPGPVPKGSYSKNFLGTKLSHIAINYYNFV